MLIVAPILFSAGVAKGAESFFVVESDEIAAFEYFMQKRHTQEAGSG